MLKSKNFNTKISFDNFSIPNVLGDSTYKYHKWNWMLIGKGGDGYKTKVHLSNQLKEGVCFGKNSKLIVGR